MKKSSRWRQAISKFNRIKKNLKPESTYREKAEMMQLKSHIDKLKQELKEAQKSNVELTQQLKDANDKIEEVRSILLPESSYKK
ncbi:MAG: hypothetical protein VXW76_03470 [Actinomycetota bacterium]|nr:hypothetical protein [Actinomycetota bacterium]